MQVRAVAVLCFAWLAGCATRSLFVDPGRGEERTFAAVADSLARADVVVLGELHGNAEVHRRHRDLVAALFDRRPDLVVSMEMFERDVQQVLLQYLCGDIDEEQFVTGSRAWKSYATDYRPIVEFARQHHLPVLAANAPRPLATKASKEGAAAVAGDPHVARATSAPKDRYWERFQAAMHGHGGAGDAKAMERMYEAQCLKDDTMAETIVDHLQAARARGEQPLVVHVCGRMHSDHGLGVVARIRQRNPELRVLVVSAEVVADPAAGWMAAPADLADFVLLVRGEPEAAGPQRQPASPAPVVAAPVAADPEAAPTGKPGLNLMPDYQHQDSGLRIADVIEGGAADAAGLRAGDVIVKLAGEPVDSMEDYLEVLRSLTVGSTVEVVCKRDGKEVALPVKVGTSTR